jgi:cytochrome oxidase assembly protein ShyY1
VSNRKPRIARVLALISLGLVLGCACGAAGVWQWHRFGEKKTADDELRAAAARPAAPVDEVLRAGIAVDDTVRFRTVSAVGRYDGSRQVLVRKRQIDDTPGFLVLTPLRTASGRTLFIDRGFIAATGAATLTPTPPDPPAGEVQVTARVLPDEGGGLGVGLPDRQIENIDVDALAARDGVPTYPAFGELISSTPPEQGLTPLPAPDLTNPAGGAFVAQHLAYVVQWFLFSGFALAGPVILLMLDRRARRREPTPPRREPAATA